MSFAPAFGRWWRNNNEIHLLAQSYFQDIPEFFTDDDLSTLGRKCVELVFSPNGLYPTLCALQERALRQMAPQLEFADRFKEIIPGQYPWILHTFSVGVVAKYTCGVPVSPRTRGLPYQQNDEAHCLTIGGKLWKDIRAERTFVCTTKTVSVHAPVEATPTTMVDKKNADRTISTDKRTIADLRRANLRFPVERYYRVSAPTVSEVARDIIQLQALNPGYLSL